MKNKLRSLLPYAIAVTLLLLVWEVLARTVNVSFIVPPLSEIFAVLFGLVFTAHFWTSIFLSLLRITMGFVIGVVLSLALAICAHFFKPLEYLLTPIVTVIRCTPVASFIMILWLLLSEAVIPSLIAVLIVFPVVWQSAHDAMHEPDKELLEMVEIYNFTPSKKLWYLTVPTMIKGVLPAIITASGLAWKSGIAAEIITYTKHSIGREIANAKFFLMGEELLAWTFVVVLLSFIVEILIKLLLRKAAKIWE
ncbi:MAG: ABC transporter permease subunit [Clostridia bacterium]|nr:ABC transporter permease subunit [Clostridia bacterium]